MKAFLIITLFFVGVIKYGESICWCHAFFDSAVGYSKFYVVKIIAFRSVQIQFNEVSHSSEVLNGIEPIVPIYDEFRTLSSVHFNIEIDWFTNADCEIVEFSIKIFVFEKVQIELE